MTTLLDLIDSAGSDVEFAEDVVNNIASRLISRWVPGKFSLDRLKSKYRVFATMNYDKMRELPENRNYIFNQTSNLEEYFGIESLKGKNILSDQPDEELASIVLGKSAEDLAFIYIESGATKMPGRIKAVKGNVTVSEEIPILYGWIPYPEKSTLRTKFEGHIEILVPLNLTYFK